MAPSTSASFIAIVFPRTSAVSVAPAASPPRDLRAPRDWPHGIRPEDWVRFGVVPFNVAFRCSGAENAVEQGDAFVFLVQKLVNWFPDQFLCRFIHLASPEERFALAQAMCEDVLQELSRWQSRPAVAVVTNDSFARGLAARFNFEIVADDNSGQTNAIEMATAVCQERGAQSTLVVPADIPLIDCAELQKIADHAPRGGAVLVPDAAGRGTNAAWRSPGNLFPLRFGNDSFLPHLAAAKATGLPCVELSCRGLRARRRSSRGSI